MSGLTRLVETSAQVTATSSRRAKIDLIAAYLAALPSESVATATAYLSGVVPQGAVGVGWATLQRPVPPADGPTLSLADVSADFDELAATTGVGAQGRRRAILERLFGRATEAEQLFLVRLLAGELRQGALEGIMSEAVARAADVPVALMRRAVMLHGRLWEVAEAAMVEGATGLTSIGLSLFQAVKPMLAQTADDVTDAVARTGPALVEWKLDGVRIQAHRAGGRVELYTRNLNRVTERLPDVVNIVGSLPVESTVLDGEALSVDADGRPARFQETAGRFSADELPQRGIRPFFFDILHRDGVDLIDLPTAERRRQLEEVAGDWVVTGRSVQGGEEAAAMLTDALASGHEGVVVKSQDAGYEAGRRGGAWLKVKPVHTLDLVVLAAEWGHGRRQGWLSNLHLGAARGDDFVMLGKTFKGLTDELLAWQTEKLQQIETRRTRSTVFVRPELVVEVALDGVQISTRYPGGVALRFARVRGYRADKDPGEADTLDAVRALGGLPPLDW